MKQGELGTIQLIEEVHDVTLQPTADLEGTGGRLGMNQMMNALAGRQRMDGYRIQTDKHVFMVLIDNQQSCCESWGYFSTEDDFEDFIGEKLLTVQLTDTAFIKKQLEEELGYHDDSAEIQFVDFDTSAGTFQLAVYNAHNGYYGHGIIVSADDELLMDDVL